MSFTTQPTADVPKYDRFVSRDLDEVVAMVSRRLAPHRLSLRDPTQEINTRLGCIPLGAASLVDLSYGADVDVDAGEIDDYLVHAVFKGAGEAEDGRRTLVMDASNIAVSSPERRARYHMTADCRKLTMRITRRPLEDYFCQALDRPIGQPILFDLTNAPHTEFFTAWRRLLLHVSEEAQLAPEALANPRVQGHYASLFFERLLHGTSHNYSADAQIAARLIASPWHVRRARTLIEARLGEALSVADVAREVGVSARSLQNGFRAAFGLTPLEYIRGRRLECLHASLLAADPATSVTVTAIMLDHGILNFGRFAQYYRQRYGCRPSDTLRRRSLS